MQEEMMGRILPESIGPASHLEKTALRETQQVLGERTVSAVLGLASAALAFGCLPDSVAGPVMLLRKGGVWLAAALCLLSLVLWWRFIRACHRLNAIGMYRRPRGVRASWNWELAGAFVSVAVVATICGILGWEYRGMGSGALPGLVVALYLGRRVKHIPDYETARKEDASVISLRQNDD